MRMKYNPSGIADRTGILQGFVSGSLMISAFLFGLGSESELVMVFMIALMVAGILVAISSFLRAGEDMYFWMTVASMVFGGIVSAAVSFFGITALGAYLLIVIMIAVIFQSRKLWKKK